MDNIPSKSISKSLLIATPLFLIIMAVLNTSNQISYLFVLDFVNNVGGKADIMFLPTLQPQIHTNDPYHELLMMGSEIETDKRGSLMQGARIPLISMSQVNQWQERNDLVKGTAPRWLFPVVADKTKIDSLVMVMNVSLQNQIGSSVQANLQPLKQDQIAIPQQLFNRLNTQVGSTLTITMAIKNLFNGMKLIQKFQDPTSSDQFTTEQPELNITSTVEKLYQQLDKSYNISQQVSEERFTQAVLALYDAELKKEFRIKYVYKESGLYPSALHNVVLMEYGAFADMLWEFVRNEVVLNQELNLTQYLPKEYQSLWKLTTKSSIYDSQAKEQLSQLLQRYCVIAVSLMNSRQLLYHPNRPLKQQFSKVLQKSPQNVEVVALYPFYEQSLNIKYFFGSVIQIFEVVTCVIYFFTMSLIMKQIYEEKEIEVGIWRTLGAGGVKQQFVERNQEKRSVMFEQDSMLNNSESLPIYRLNQRLSLTEKIRYYLKIMVKIGFLYYWLASSLLSILLYMLIKYFLIKFICQLLYFDQLQQNYSSAGWLFLGVFGLSQFLVINHIRSIYTAPLSLTIKPLKRTFDEVKIRVIHLATFGVSSQTLLIAMMLIYYGVVSYYWIPFSILDNDGDLQVLLFNSIFIFMIFGAIILIAVLQSRLQRIILRALSAINKRLSRIKSIMLKNIKAKQYKNTKMSIIIAVTFAFLLFFSTGINIEIMIVESFIERQLGAELVLENYEKKSFDQEKIQSYLNTLQEVKYSWISADINSDDVKLQLVNQMDPIRKIYCQWKVMTPNYLDSAFYQYYYPQNYMFQNISSYRILGNGVINGFDALYKYDHKFNNQSIGRFDPSDTMRQFDPNRVNIYQESGLVEDMVAFNQMAPNEQVINFAASSLLKLQMGSNVGDLYKLRITSNSTPYYLNVRSRIVHSYKVGPGMDLLRPQAFITQQQAKYLLTSLGHNDTIRYQKLLISGPEAQLKQIGNKILAMSPQHTQMFQMKIVAESFQLLQKYLSFYIVLIATIMGTLAVLFVFLYTLGKCRDEAEMYKMLRAIGVSVTDLRIMIFLEILIRLFVSITNGILLGIVFSLGFGMQIEQFLMINTPGMDLSLIMNIAAIMFAVFCVTVYLATKYLTKKTVADTAKN